MVNLVRMWTLLSIAAVCWEPALANGVKSSSGLGVVDTWRPQHCPRVAGAACARTGSLGLVQVGTVTQKTVGLPPELVEPKEVHLTPASVRPSKAQASVAHVPPELELGAADVNSSRSPSDREPGAVHGNSNTVFIHTLSGSMDGLLAFLLEQAVPFLQQRGALLQQQAAALQQQTAELVRTRSGTGVVMLVLVLLLLAGLVVSLAAQMRPGAFRRGSGGSAAGAALIGTGLRRARSGGELSRSSSRSQSAPLRPTSPRAEPATQPASAKELNEASSRNLDAFFCADLVVPQSCECILLVPIQPLTQGPFEVVDLNGNVVLQVTPRHASFRPFAGSAPSTSTGDAGRDPAGPLQRLIVMTSYGNMLAQCGVAPGRSTSSRRGVEFHLLRAAGDYFAKLTSNDAKEGGGSCLGATGGPSFPIAKDRFTLATRTGMRLHFWGSLEHHAMNVTDDPGKLLATTESGGSLEKQANASGEPTYYKLRVAPLMDVGLVLCGLLCIEHLA